MKQIGNRAIVLFVVFAIFLSSLGIFITKYSVQGESWAAYPTNRHLYNNGKLFKAGNITDRSGVVLAETIDGIRFYSNDKEIRRATIHAVGDLEGKISTGAHSAFRQKLTGYDIVNGTYNFSGEGNNIKLNIDANLHVQAIRAMGSNTGTVGVMNYKTGEIICMISTETFDPNDPPSNEEAQKGMYVNKLLSGKYAPGSIFKLVTAAAAIENIPDIFERTFTCEKGVEIEGEWVSCLSKHGEIGFEKGMVHSCNAVFAQLAVELGKDNMVKTAERLGFNKSLTVDGIKCAESSYVVKDARNIDLAWSGMGQYNDIVNPMQYLFMMAAIANGGEVSEPEIINQFSTPSGLILDYKLFDGKKRLLSGKTAEKLNEMMRNNVKDNYGDRNFPGLELCGKTGTAEIGDTNPHSWFVGFCRNEEKPYAFVVIAEYAGSGIGVSSRIANKVLQAAPKVR